MAKAAGSNNLWKNRIVGYGEKAAADFVLNPLNPKRHPDAQQAAIAAALSEIGWVTGVIENVRTGHLVDGESRVTEALKNNANEVIPYIKVDLSLEEEKKVLLVFDRIGALALDDTERISELLSSITFESDALSGLLEQVQTPEIDLDAFFEPAAIEPQPEKYELIISFDKEVEYNAAISRLQLAGMTARDVLNEWLSADL